MWASGPRSFDYLKLRLPEAEQAAYFTGVMNELGADILLLYTQKCGVDATSLASVGRDDNYAVQGTLHCGLDHFRSQPTTVLAGVLRNMLSRYEEGRWGPLLGSDLKSTHAQILFEDVHLALPSSNEFTNAKGSQPIKILEILRGLLNNDGVWGLERNKLWARLEFLHVMATALESSYSDFSPRLLRHFYCVRMEPPSESSTHLFTQNNHK